MLHDLNGTIMRTIHDTKSDLSPTNRKPYAMVGAGRLAASIWKDGDECTGWKYRFNLFRLAENGRVGQKFKPTDLKHLVKLVQVLAATLADDGCLKPSVRRELERLSASLARNWDRE